MRELIPLLLRESVAGKLWVVESEPFASMLAFAQDAPRMDVPCSFIADASWNTAQRVGNLKNVPSCDL